MTQQQNSRLEMVRLYWDIKSLF